MLYANIVEGSFNTFLFEDFIKGLLDQMQPYPAPNSVIVMENCCIHKSPKIREIIETRFVLLVIFKSDIVLEIYSGMKLEFLPAYLPDFNPIKQAFSAIKSYMRRHYHYLSWSSTGTDSCNEVVVYIRLHEAIFSITTDDSKGFYYHSGYVDKD
jgi:transposase